jgi:non-ribosomal peptide synthetase component E (peptide arylation enzyme)
MLWPCNPVLAYEELEWEDSMANDLRQSAADQAHYRAVGIWPDLTFADVLSQRVGEHPEKIALVDEHRSVTYRQLEDGIIRVADLLRQQGIGQGDVVAVQIPNKIEFVLCYFAIERVGAIGVPISIDFRSREVEYVLTAARCRGIICCGINRGFDHLGMVVALRPGLANLSFVGVVNGAAPENVHALDGLLAESGRPADFEEIRAHPDSLMRMMFTSGTTGKPKGVTHNHNTSLWPARMLNMDMEIGREDVMLLYLPLALNWGYLTVLQTVLAGGRLVIMEQFRARVAIATIEREKVTYIPTAPAAIVSILNLPGQEKYDLSSLRTVICGGTSCPVETIRAARKRIDADLIELYGMLECGGYHTYTRRTDDPEEVTGSVGRCGTEMRLRISPIGGTGEIAQGQVGEIQSSGPSTQLGYHDNPDANAEAFTDDGWFRSGDLGMIDANGNLCISGRLKEMINRGGKKYPPREIEEILYTHPKVLHAAVIGLPDERLGERSCLCVILRVGEALPILQDFVDFLKDGVATYKLPERLEIFSEFPYTPTGKIQRHVLVQEVLARDSQ